MVRYLLSQMPPLLFLFTQNLVYCTMKCTCIIQECKVHQDSTINYRISTTTNWISTILNQIIDPALIWTGFLLKNHATSLHQNLREIGDSDSGIDGKSRPRVLGLPDSFTALKYILPPGFQWRIIPSSKTWWAAIFHWSRGGAIEPF